MEGWDGMGGGRGVLVLGWEGWEGCRSRAKYKREYLEEDN